MKNANSVGKSDVGADFYDFVSNVAKNHVRHTLTNFDNYNLFVS